MSIRRRTLIAAAVAGALGGFAASQSRGAEPERVVVVGGDLTEIAYALGAGDKIVGADTTSSWPPETSALPKVGYARRLSPEGVLSLRPDLVLAAPGAGPQTALDRLKAAGVAVETAPDIEGAQGVPPKMRFVADALGANADPLIAAYDAELAALDAALDGVETGPSVMFLISAGRGAPMASGVGTAADAIIAMARGRNAVTGFDGYKPLSAEAAILAAPDVLLLPTHAVEALGGVAAILARPEIAATPAGRAGRVVVMDGLTLLGFGPRTPAAALELARELHAGLEG